MGIANAEPGNSLRSLVETLAERLVIAEKVALAKWDSGAAVEDVSREAQIIQAEVKDGDAMGLDSTQVEGFFRAQFEASKVIQYSLLAEWRHEGKAPAHAPVDLLKEVRPQLDELDRRLIAELSATMAMRSAETCHVDVARAVGEYLDARKLKADSREAVTLDRAMAGTCTR